MPTNLQSRTFVAAYAIQKYKDSYTENYNFACAISGFHNEVAENCTLLGYYAVSSGNFLSILAA
jgi:hypothetical protein